MKWKRKHYQSVNQKMDTTTLWISNPASILTGQYKYIDSGFHLLNAGNRVKWVLHGYNEVTFSVSPLLLLSWPLGSRETPCCKIQTGNECEQGPCLSGYKCCKKLFLDGRGNLESCYCSITIHCYACFECRLLRLLREENSLVNSPLWAEKDMRKITLSQESNVPLTPTAVSPSLDQSGWICQVTVSQGLLGCSQDPVCNSFFAWGWETEMC